MSSVQNNSTGAGLIFLILIIVVGVWGWHTFHPDNSKPWWNGAQSMTICAVGQNSNSYAGSDNGNSIGCHTAMVTSDGNKITNLNSSLAQGTSCGKITSRYCDFYDIQDKQWEVKKD